MRLLYIDLRKYGHNSDIHINFIRHLEKRRYFNIYGYGEHMHNYFEKSSIPNKKNPKKDLGNILKKFRPHYILSYNCNGSSYEMGFDNVAHFSWITEALSKIDIPKFHITTDYCRSGFRAEQAQWFSDINCTEALFRHKVALRHPIDVNASWFPFSLDKGLYKRNNLLKVEKKNPIVGFVGTAHNSSRTLYKNRIAAFDYLMNEKMLKTTDIVNPRKKRRRMLFGSKYVRFWTKNLFGLTCGGTCKFMVAKYFQIPAAYSMLICTQTSGLEIFPKDTYILYERKNMEKLKADIFYHIRDVKTTKHKIKTLHNYVIENHDHDTRARELIRIMKRYS